MSDPTVARDLGESHRSRGRYKIFLGMAAGVGKTYRMLQEGQAAAEDGRDVAIGYLEPHGRVETLAQAEGLEVIPRRTVRYRDVTMTEMDLPGVLRRAPELCLIDELAHTNAPGVEHHKRYEDIADVLTAGIDVYSTVNVQHLESLNDQVAELTEIRVRETVPDSILASADDVVLIDITPDSLLERLRAGKVYPPERVQSALHNFFKVENLTALREVSLRQVAEEIEAKRLPPPAPAASGGPSTRRGAGRDDERLLDTHAPSAIGERLLALDHPAAGVAAGGAPRLALGAAARGRARSAVGRAARAARRRSRATRGAAPAGGGARRPPADRARHRHRRGRGAGRA